MAPDPAALRALIADVEDPELVGLIGRPTDVSMPAEDVNDVAGEIVESTIARCDSGQVKIPPVSCTPVSCWMRPEISIGETMKRLAAGRSRVDLTSGDWPVEEITHKWTKNCTSSGYAVPMTH